MNGDSKVDFTYCLKASHTNQLTYMEAVICNLIFILIINKYNNCSLFNAPFSFWQSFNCNMPLFSSFVITKYLIAQISVN